MTMAKIQFKAKKHSVSTIEGEVIYHYVTVPNFSRSHCDMNAFRFHKKYGAYANSDLFKSILLKIRKEVFPSGMLKLNQIPEGVFVDDSGFLTVISFEV
jgi:hypothetical protein